jgi:hypothetical protein
MSEKPSQGPPKTRRRTVLHYNLLGSPRPLPIKQRRPWAVDENEYHALCEVLNWTDDEAKKAALKIERHAEAWEGDAKHERRVREITRPWAIGALEAWERRPQHDSGVREAGACAEAIAVLRTLGVKLLEHPAEKSRYPREEYIIDTLGLSQYDLFLLEFVANRPVKFYQLRVLDLPPGLVDVSTRYPDSGSSRVIWATRALWPLLTGHAKLSRCPAPVAGSVSKRRCDRYFVSGGRPGRPAEHCSAACRQRKYRRVA